MKLTKNFSVKECACKHCGKCEMDEEFMEILQAIREEFGKPMKLTSAYRCSKYNQQISSSGANGPHTTGKAVDVLVSGKDAFEFEGIARKHGIQGIGYDQKGEHSRRYIHIDTLEEATGRPRPWIWTY